MFGRDEFQLLRSTTNGRHERRNRRVELDMI